VLLGINVGFGSTFNSTKMSFRLKFTLFTIVVINLAFQGKSYAQNEAETFTAKNLIFAEAGGNAVRYSVNYGRIFNQKGKLKLSGSVGFSMWYFDTFNHSGSTAWFPSLPMEISGFWGRSKHHLEIGVGTTHTLSPVRDEIGYTAHVPFRLGYRYQKPGGGYVFRIGYMPAFKYSSITDEGINSVNFYPVFAGISLGKSF
jgi:hypothetical protein